MRIRTLAVVFLLVTSAASSAFADCLADLVMSAKSQMACCEAGRSVCQKDGGAFDCCKSEGQRQQHLTLLAVPKAPPVQPQALTVSAIINPAPSPTTLQAPRFAFSPRLLKGVSPPLYLLAGAFLI